MTTDPIKWLQDVRKIDGALLAHMGVVPKEHPQLGPTAAFVYRKAGEPLGAKFRGFPKEWRSSQGVTRPLYNLDVLTAEHDRPVVITEGEIDCLSVMQSGYPRAVSLPDGWTEQGNKTEALLEAEDLLRKSPFVIVAGDNDKAGESLPRAVANILKGHDVRFVEWPEGCKDANDVLVNFGEGELANCLQAAKQIDPPDGFITRISDLPPLSARRVLKTGIREIDFRLAFELGAMSVITGIPGHGKSTFVTFAADRIAKSEGIRVGMMAFETHPHKIRDHLTRLATGQPYDKLTDTQQSATAAQLDRFFSIVHRTYDGGAHALPWLEEMVYALAVRDECKLIIIDPWNELEHMPMPGESLTNYINFATQQIRTWAEKLEVHICVVAHPKKMNMDFKPRAPMGYDVADSAAFYNKPSNGLTVFQSKSDDGLPLTELVSWKVRDTQLYGSTKGVSQLHFDPDKMTYEPFEQLADAS